MGLQDSYEAMLRANESYLDRARREARSQFATAAAGGSIARTGYGNGVLNGSRIAQRALLSVDSGATVSVVNMILVGLSQVNGPIHADLARFGDELAKKTGRRDGLADIHAKVARSAQAAVVASYFYRVGKLTPARQRGRLKGQMVRALQDRRFITTTHREIAFGDISMLYKVAPHWRRLNFGAGGLGQRKQPEQATFNFALTGRGGKLQLPHNPAPSFRMPPGVFFDGDDFRSPVPFNASRSRSGGGPGDNFYPASQIPKVFAPRGMGSIYRATGGKPTFYTRGIEGAHFFDAGLKRIAKDLPEQYALLAQKWANTPRPRGRSVRVVAD